MNYKVIPSIKVTLLLLSSIAITACTSDTQIEPKKVNIEQLHHNWKLTHIDNIQLATIINSSLSIDSGNNSTGNLGCNNFFGAAELSNNQLRIAKMGSTRKMCSPLENDVEMDVSQVLVEWADVMIDKNTLILSNSKHSLTYQMLEN